MRDAGTVAGCAPSNDGGPPRSVAGSLGACHKRGDRATAPFSIFAISRFSFSFAEFAFKAHEMRRIDLSEATMQGWARLDAAQRQRFFEAFLKAALRLDRLELRAWLRRRLNTRRSPLRSIRPALQFRMPTLPFS